MNFRISEQKTNIMKETKYLRMVMDEHLTFQNHTNTVKLRLNRANSLLAKLRHYVNPVLLRTTYYVVFESHLRYGCQLREHQSYKLFEKNPKQSTKNSKFSKRITTK